MKRLVVELLDNQPHLHLLPIHARDAVDCGLCGRRGHDVICDRCGSPMHDACYWQRAAGPIEHTAFLEADEYMIVCRGCRS